MIAVASAVEPLRMANRLANRHLYNWSMLTLDGQPVAASNGMRTQPDCDINSADELDIIFVCGGINITHHGQNKEMIRWLQKQSHQDVSIGALCTGTYALAKANLLKNHRCTVHWEIIDAMREEFPELNITKQLFEIDNNRYTCTGGQAPLDMMIGIIKKQNGNELANDISDEFLIERIRDDHDSQRIPTRFRYGRSRPKLVAAVTLMEANIEEPINLTEIADHVSLSRRQLQRLFRTCLDTSPTEYYLHLRLERARQLLHFTSKSVLEIGLACGFGSAPHFSKSYRDHYGVAPSEERKRGREIFLDEPVAS